jgi:hypoxanthine phosphoribosyltransferase
MKYCDKKDAPMSNCSVLEPYPGLESVFMDRAAIAERVSALAAAIRRDYAAQEPLYLISILKGGCFFACDLARALQEKGMYEIRMEFIRASTYGDGIKGSDDTERSVRIATFAGEIAGKQVLLVDDVIDQGFTLSALKRHFLAGGAESVRVAVFLEKTLAKPTAAVRALRAAFRADYVGAAAPDRWIVGYGLDLGERFRELPFLAIANEAYFR